YPSLFALLLLRPPPPPYFSPLPLHDALPICLIAVKTAAFGLATNWTLGLPFLRTSVDHGTAFGIAGRGIADERPLAHVIETTLRSEEHTSELQSLTNLVCRLLLAKKKHTPPI